jgi:hypothetical protein
MPAGIQSVFRGAARAVAGVSGYDNRYKSANPE